MLSFISSLAPWFWLGLLIVCLIIEGFTWGLTTIWGALAALPMIFLSLTGLPFQWQLLIFVVVTLVLVIFTRPFALKKLKIGKAKTNVDSMIGEEVLVSKVITKFQKGEVKSKNGVIWAAQSSNDEEIPEGTLCKILSVNGNTLMIEKINE